ncbi:MAG: hypothetical protein R2755_11345 [Acidimicrobiales bacterium]
MANALRDAFFDATVSARALIILAPTARSLAHGGTRPQRTWSRRRAVPSS